VFGFHQDSDRGDADVAHLGFVAGCKAGGKPINGLTVGGTSGSSNGDLHLVANSGALAAALVGVVAYIF
jgi:hypothetical protein